MDNRCLEKYLKILGRAWMLICMLIQCRTIVVGGTHVSKFLVVATDGSGDFRSIQDAINHLPDTAVRPRIIYIKNGIYKEKLFIDKNFVTLKGESRAHTVLIFSEARDIWRCLNEDDWGAATINMKGNDLTLENLSVINNYGYLSAGNLSHPCTKEHDGMKVIEPHGHQMVLRSFATTRLIAKNCIFKSGGGDTVSPWNKESGMYYFKNCIMEGYVDFYCPRGWSYAENCIFICHSLTAAIWHDGSGHQASKSVLKNCKFQGVDNFKLGRHHWDAQFYLINCFFSQEMADANIYSAAPEGRILQWGKRIYYHNCHRETGDYAWHKDNMSGITGITIPEKINAAWAFDGQWDPTKILQSK